MNERNAYRGMIFYFKDSANLNNVPTKKEHQTNNSQYVFIDDGLLIVDKGKIEKVGKFNDIYNELGDINIVDYSNKLITPGFIDTHQHATQSSIVASYGEKLLEWLESYVFQGESYFSDGQYARKDLNFFLDELLKNGTTTSVSYGPLFYEAADIFFEELSNRNMRFITGNILMDKNSPETLRLSTQQNYENCQKLLAKWHNHKRLSYCISPRFALSCSDEILEICGSLKKEYPDCYIQTHLNENVSEVAEVAKTYPWSKNYLDVYDHYGLVTDKTVLGHCIHMQDEELKRIRETGAIISWCPVSNNFLGSGLFDYKKTRDYTQKITLGTDWGGGNTLSMFAVLDDAYKVSMLKGTKLPSMVRWYLATFGAAKALQLDDKIGNFESGKEADFIVIDLEPTSYFKYRREKVNDIFDFLFILMTLGSEINIYSTYIYGKQAYVKGN